MFNALMLLRYPGGKAKISEPIIKALIDIYKTNPSAEYREPFFGGGSIGFKLLSQNKIQKVWINDFDRGMSALWTATIIDPDGLKEKINEFTPSINAFYEFKKELLNVPDIYDITDVGFKKLAIHQLSYSGLGTKSGGPLGGVDQKSEYKIDCRWSPKTLHNNIDKANKYLSQVELRGNKCWSRDFEELLIEDCPAFLYLDPPYFIKGNEMYQHGFATKDHERLANSLRKSTHSWVLSYDDCPAIRKLYSWAGIKEIELKYTINTVRNKVELLITP